MKRYSGKAVQKGIVSGPVLVWKREEEAVCRISIENVDGEEERMAAALDETKRQLEVMERKTEEESGKEAAALFEVDQMILEDQKFAGRIEEVIREEKVNAEYAAELVGNEISGIFAGMEDAYMRERATDILELSHRLIQNLEGKKEAHLDADEPVILVAEEIRAGELAGMDRRKILAIVTARGSYTCHTAILARMNEIPALMGVDFPMEEMVSGKIALVDGFQGDFLVEPDQKTLLEAEQKKKKEEERRLLLRELKEKPSITKDGKKISVYANVASSGALEEVLENGAEGIGLFRSEFLYLGKRELPTEEEQYWIYRQFLQKMEGKEVVIRTFDLGSDKEAPCLPMEREANPALGIRGIRLALQHPEVFRTQLRALLRAAVYGNLSVMYPMITSKEEVRTARAWMEEEKQKLDEKGIPCRIPRQGIMIETPAAAILSKELSRESDFFCIGTNDLAQYTLAIDREQGQFERRRRESFSAVLRLMQMTVENGHDSGIPTAVCGELAADPSFTEIFLKMGVDELSVPPLEILNIRNEVRSLSLRQTNKSKTWEEMG